MVKVAMTDIATGAPPRRSADSAALPFFATTWRLGSVRVFVAALAMSAAVHVTASLWPVDLDSDPEAVPLTATLKELPPPPKTAAVAAKPHPRRSPPRPMPAPAVPNETPASTEAPETAKTDPAGKPAAEELAQLSTAAPTAPEAPPPPPPKPLPPRVDLAYKVFLGTQGFWIGDATYRFEHHDNEYRIVTIGQPQGLAALLIRGQGKIESRGVITPQGLIPLTFAIERGSSDRREVASFDWDAQLVTLHDLTTAALESPTYDPLTLFWQSYFTPPTSDEQAFHVATTRKVLRHTVTRTGSERVEWGDGEAKDTEIWHRASEDGQAEAWVWLAPSLNYVPIKLRMTSTNRGTLEALLEAIRVDAPTVVAQ